MFSNLRGYLVSNMRSLLSQSYVEIGLIQTVCDVPVDDALRGGIELRSKQLDESQIDDLLTSLDRDNDLTTAGQSEKWSRLFGGAGILIIVADQDPEQPLDLKSISSDTSIEFRAADLWELFFNQQSTEDFDPSTSLEHFEFYNYYGEKIHKSRVLRVKGMPPPSFIRPRLRGWGLSAVEVLVRSINQYLKATDLTFEVLDEFKVDIYKIKNLVNTLASPAGAQKILERIQLANRQKNYQNAVTMDSEDDWDHKQLSFTGISETMAGVRMQVAADLRMPITKLFGTSASAGIGNTDQNDMENYNSMVESQVRNKLKFNLLKICELKCQKLFGFIPDDLKLTFKPLRVLGAVEEESVKTTKFARLIQMKAAGEISTQEFRDACNKDNLLAVQLDTTEDVLNPADSETKEIIDSQNPSKKVEEKKPAPVSNEAEVVPKLSEDGAYDAAFDLISYEKEGGNDWITLAEMQALETPADEALWLRASEASMKYVKSESLKFKIWWYRKMGGQFLLSELNVPAASLAYDAADDAIAYRLAGGNDWINATQMSFFEHPEDAPLWEKAALASQKYLKSENLKYKIWFYRKKGGRFGDGSSMKPIQNQSWFDRMKNAITIQKKGETNK